MKVLIVGSGGREHCLAWKIKQSPKVEQVYTAPGNAGTAGLGKNVDIKTTDIKGLLAFAEEKGIGLTVVGPEAPLAEGIVDVFTDAGLKIFGPVKELARLEGSKVFAKEIMNKFSVPTAPAEVFSDPGKAKQYINSKNLPLVVKADGLAAGKGVIVCQDKETALKAIDAVMIDKKFGSAGDRVLIEDCLQGEEVSILAVSSGEDFLTLTPSQDHKRAYEGDKGPNTGGMGAYAPALLVDEQLLEKINQRIFNPLLKGLSGENKKFKGVLYGGLMIQQGEPYVLEFNVRFGDPETQVVLPKLNNDLVEIILKSINGESFSDYRLEQDQRPCLCTVLASGGYPGTYQKGKVVRGLEQFDNKQDVFVFHAGTKLGSCNGSDKQVLTNGGRVLNVVALGEDLKSAQDKVYQNVEKITFENMYYRKDIGNKAIF